MDLSKVSNTVIPNSNHAGGTLGGITTGQPIIFRVAFKPTSSIKKPQHTTTLLGEETTYRVPKKGRHDPCVAIRAIPVVEAMCSLVLADSVLIQQTTQVKAS